MNSPAEPAGPLQGVRVLDMSALGPGPFCSMLLADFGAEVVTVERPDPPAFDPAKFFSRGKRSTVVDLRAPGPQSGVRMPGSPALVSRVLRR